jgi:hypothetical protein
MRTSIEKEQAMHDLPRISFLVVMNALLLAMLVMVLGGCVSTPAQNRYRHGDFIMNIGSAAPVEPVAVAATQAPADSSTTQPSLASSNAPRRG